MDSNNHAPTPKFTACHICHGLGYIGSGDSETKDCPNLKCINGLIKTKEKENE